MPLPPRWVRRTLLAPAVLLLALAMVTTLPVWIFVAAGASLLVPGRLRVLRLFWIAAVYLVWDAVALTALFGLWLASGCGWKIRSPAFQRAHYVLTGWFLTFFFWHARWALRLSIDVVGTDPDTALPGRPELVVCRHAGPGDSFILIHGLVNWFDREPRIVLKETLQWDPAIDVLLNRLPNRFIAPGDKRAEPVETQIAHLATGLDANDAFVIFPEGGNFTPVGAAAPSTGCTRWDCTAWRPEPSRCGTCWRPAPAGCSRRSTPHRTPGSSSPRTPAWTGC